MSRIGAVALALVTLFVATPLEPAAADADETERRLKTAGVDDGLRAKIHRAIDRGVAFLGKRQAPDGSFEEASKPGVNVLRTTLLCALALQHAGTAAADGPVAKAVDWSFVKDAVRVRLLEKQVHEGSLALMFLAGVPGREETARRIAGGIAAGLDEKTGWWGHDTPGDVGAAEAKPFAAMTPNLKDTQLAALGLWASRRKGIDVPTRVWARHAEALCDLQRRHGSWNEVLDMAARAEGLGAAGYGIGAVNVYMGLANLLVSRQAIVDAKAAPELLARVDVAIPRARAAMTRVAHRTLSSPEILLHEIDPLSGLPSVDALPTLIELPGPFAPGFGTYHTLYALENACLFADIEAIELPQDAAKKGKPPPKPKSKPWFATGARWLCDKQHRDGGWATDVSSPSDAASSVADTAYALLFLLRSSSTFHPTTPQPIDARPRGATTPSAPDAGPAPAMGR